MKITLVGSRYFGATVFEALRKDGIDIARVVAPAADDRLALAAKGAGVPVHVLDDPKLVPGEAIAKGTDVIVAAHTHARVSDDALARARLGSIGYHPSLLPRHRGIAAVEWTILEGDPIAGGTVYHLADGWDAGAIAAQDWCFVRKGETARELWERALAPMGLRLLTQVLRHAAGHDALPTYPQDEQFATRAPMIRRSMAPTAQGGKVDASLVVTVIGKDRPGLVSLLSERAQGFGANWAESRMTRIDGEFAGIAHFEVASANAQALTTALRSLESEGLRVVVAKGDAQGAPAGRRVRLESAAPDRPGIVHELSKGLAGHGIGIENLETEIVDGVAPGARVFRIRARLAVPDALDDGALREAVQALAREMDGEISLSA
ncbi:MAG: formyl transferase [Betaproteobacteria bacterium]|nr:formyl transferase [Betaproteobacteria bacterium]